MSALKAPLKAPLHKTQAQKTTSEVVQSSRLLTKLPPELRLSIYRHVLTAGCDLKIATGKRGEVITQPGAYWWEERDESGLKISFYFNYERCRKVSLGDVLLGADGREGGDGDEDGNGGRLRDWITEVLGLDFAEHELLTDGIDTFRSNGSGRKNVVRKALRT